MSGSSISTLKIVHFCANKDVNLFAYGTCSSAIAILCLNNALQNGVEMSDEKMRKLN